MAKFIKSIFHSSANEKKSIPHGELEGDGDIPVSDRRKLSMSRSGRLKHSYKKRHSLSKDLYGENEMQLADKPKSMEYHVHTPVTPSEPYMENARRKSIDANTNMVHRNGSKSPEEEIDSAFEIIDKS